MVAQPRENAVGGNKCRPRMTMAGCVNCGDLLRGLSHRARFDARGDLDATRGAACGQECCLQIPAMGHPIRRTMAGLDPGTEREPLQGPASSAVTHKNTIGLANVGQKVWGYAQPAQDMNAVRSDLNTGPGLGERLPSLDHFDRTASSRESQGCRQTSDAASGDNDPARRVHSQPR